MMNTDGPIAMLFGGLEKLGPGSDADTLQVLSSLPRDTFSIIVDAGAGTGRQTLTLAKRINSLVHAVDT